MNEVNGAAAQTETANLGVLGEDAPEQIQNRLAKRQRLLDEGTDPYPVELAITTTIPEIREQYGDLEAGEELTETKVGLAGRVMLQRSGGKIAFATIQDGPGNRIQVLLSLANVGEERLADFKQDVDLGDFIFVEGYVGTSKRGELSVFAREWKMASKAIRPLPKVYKNDAGEDVSLSEESRVRLRHLDLITRPAARNMVTLRAGVMKSLRN
ncbi:OB-fold nucleic acid binding domain-containing protein, partial [Actinobaculum massiliense]